MDTFRSPSRRFGETLIEVITVIALIGLLTVLVLGAVQRVRGAADRLRCQNSLRQLGLALQNFHSVNGSFPPGVRGNAADEPTPFLSWCSRLLPFLEEENLWGEILRAYQEDRDFLHNPPHSALGIPMRHFACPSDARVWTAQAVQGGTRRRGLTSYLGVSGLNSEVRDGVLFLNSTVSIADIADGTSNTLMVGERPPSKDLILGWWYAGSGQAWNGDGDSVLGVRTENNSVYGPRCGAGPYSFGPGRFDNQCDAFHFWSPHPGGANFLLCDGSVRFIRYSADPVFPALATRAGGEPAGLP